MVEIHQRFALSLVLYYAAVGVWGIFLGARKSPMSPGYRGALFIAVILGVVQAGLGLTLVLGGLRPEDNLHFLYGASVIVTVPLVVLVLLFQHKIVSGLTAGAVKC